MDLEVICIGSATIDTIAVIPRLPGSDGRAMASEVIEAGGGPAATAAVALARLGARVGFCGVVGDDDAGADVIDGLEREGVRTDWTVVRPGARTTRSVVVVSSETARRMIIVRESLPLDPAEVPVGVAEWLHLDQVGFAPARYAVEVSGARQRVSLDAGNPVDTADLREIDLYVPTVDSLRDRYVTDEAENAARAALEDGARAVVATDGSRGSLVVTNAGSVRIPAFEVDVVSTLGAGDVFHGALLASVLSGSTLDVATVQASAAAAMSCAAIDGRSAIPTRAELDDFLRRSRHTEDMNRTTKGK